MTGRIDGKVALVTGAASGIGLGIARRFATEGARLVLGDVDDAGLAAVATELGDACVTAHCDVTVEADQAALADLATSRFGRLDIGVANAGAGHFSPIVDHDLADWKRIIDLCLTGVFLTLKHVGRVMTAHGNGGSIISIASLNAVQPSAGMSAYCAAKAGVAMLDEVAAMELGPQGIRVNTIAPGLVETNATGGFFALPGIVEEFVDNTTVGRYAQPADIAALALFLASDDASFVSASLYSIDGGARTKRYPDLIGAFSRLAAQS